MWTYNYTDELYHHGILGMHWGHRKEQNKLYEKYKKKDSRNSKLNKLYNDTYSYGKKHKLDLDDGGGGSKKAGKKYMDMWDQYYKLRDKIDADAKSKAYNYIKKKYYTNKSNKEIYKEIRRQQNINTLNKYLKFSRKIKNRKE